MRVGANLPLPSSPLVERCASLATLEIDLWVTIFEHVDNILARMLCGSPCKVWVQVILLVDLVQSSEKIYVCCIGFLAGEWRVLKFKEMSFSFFLGRQNVVSQL